MRIAAVVVATRAFSIFTKKQLNAIALSFALGKQEDAARMTPNVAPAE
jgi:hypothetical protein